MNDGAERADAPVNTGSCLIMIVKKQIILDFYFKCGKMLILQEQNDCISKVKTLNKLSACTE